MSEHEPSREPIIVDPSRLTPGAQEAIKRRTKDMEAIGDAYANLDARAAAAAESEPAELKDQAADDSELIDKVPGISD